VRPCISKFTAGFTISRCLSILPLSFSAFDPVELLGIILGGKSTSSESEVVTLEVGDFSARLMRFSKS